MVADQRVVEVHNGELVVGERLSLLPGLVVTLVGVARGPAQSEDGLESEADVAPERPVTETR